MDACLRGAPLPFAMTSPDLIQSEGVDAPSGARAGTSSEAASPGHVSLATFRLLLGRLWPHGIMASTGFAPADPGPSLNQEQTSPNMGTGFLAAGAAAGSGAGALKAFVGPAASTPRTCSALLRRCKWEPSATSTQPPSSWC